MSDNAAGRKSDELDEAELLDVLTSLKDGHFSTRMAYTYTGRAGQVAAALNETLDLLVEFRTELLRTAEELGVTGRLGGQMHLPGSAGGAWREMAAGVNLMGANLTRDLRLLSQSAAASASGAPRPYADPHVRGEVRALVERVNALAERVAAPAG